MTGWTELKLHWRALAAATIGLSVGLSLIAYINSVFGPYLIAEFAWSRAEFWRAPWTGPI